MPMYAVTSRRVAPSELTARSVTSAAGSGAGGSTSPSDGSLSVGAGFFGARLRAGFGASAGTSLTAGFVAGFAFSAGFAEVLTAGGATGSLAIATAGTRSHSSLLKLRWKVENPDNDELIYRLWFRQENQPVWRPLGGPDPLSKPEYDWNTDSVPDGHYLIRVWASDEKVTPKDRALDFTFDSSTFLVDNTRPVVVDLQAQLPRVTGRVHDAASVISQIEFSIDGNDWRPASPDDGILDEMTEAFSIQLPPSLAAGPHIITVRAWDSADNLGSAHIQIQIAK